MNKSLTCIALLFAIFFVAHGGPDRNRGSGGQRPGGSGGSRPGGDGSLDQLASKLCANETLARQFVTQMQQLFTTLQANGSFTQVLADRAQEVAYIQNTNTDVLSTNCTGYFSNLKSALDADRAVVEAREQYQRIAAKAIMDIIANLIGRRRN